MSNTSINFPEFFKRVKTPCAVDLISLLAGQVIRVDLKEICPSYVIGRVAEEKAESRSEVRQENVIYPTEFYVSDILFFMDRENSLTGSKAAFKAMELKIEELLEKGAKWAQEELKVPVKAILSHRGEVKTSPFLFNPPEVDVEKKHGLYTQTLLSLVFIPETVEHKANTVA